MIFTELYVVNAAEILPPQPGEKPRLSAAAHLLARRVLAQKLGCTPNQLEFTKGEHGKPYLVNNRQLFFNLSHSGEMLALAVSEGHEVGVDIQSLCHNERVEARVFTPGERELIKCAANCEHAFTSLWALKESYLKAIGTGFLGNATEIEFYSFDGEIKSNASGFKFSVSLHGDYAVAVCTAK